MSSVLGSVAGGVASAAAGSLFGGGQKGGGSAGQYLAGTYGVAPQVLEEQKRINQGFFDWSGQVARDRNMFGQNFRDTLLNKRGEYIDTGYNAADRLITDNYGQAIADNSAYMRPYIETGAAADRMLTPALAGGYSSSPNAGLFAGALQNANGNDNLVASLLGSNGSDPMAALRSVPGYQFSLQEAQRAADTSSAARGNFFSPDAVREFTRVSEGLASQNYNTLLQAALQAAGQGVQTRGQASNDFIGYIDRLNSVGARGQNAASAANDINSRLLSGRGDILARSALGRYVDKSALAEDEFNINQGIANNYYDELSGNYAGYNNNLLKFTEQKGLNDAADRSRRGSFYDTLIGGAGRGALNGFAQLLSNRQNGGYGEITWQ